MKYNHNNIVFKKMVDFLDVRRWEKGNRTDFYWRDGKACVVTIQCGSVKKFCVLIFLTLSFYQNV